MHRPAALLLIATFIVSCGTAGDAAQGSVTTSRVSSVTTSPTTSATTTSATTTTSPTQPTTTIADPFAQRPFEVFTPSSYSAETPTPLVVLLHGFGADGAAQEAYFRLQPAAEAQGFLAVHPDGTINAIGKQFWNATDACCGFGTTVDDSAYLIALIEKVQADFNVDPKRIYLVGHSNGGFMSYRMACDHADKIAAIVSLAGATFMDTAQCDPSEPVSVLQIHGTADATIPYEGGTIYGHDHPGARETVADWATYDRCGATTTDSTTALDLDSSIDGAESTAFSFDGCAQGSAVELWTIPGGPHVPPLSATFAASIVGFLLAHPKP